MIQLQRASAGSGKTFTLARKFIGYLISRPDTPQDAGGPRLARSKGEILRSLRKILAITFTNMATTEMKQRIVDKLAALSLATNPGTQEQKIDYLSDFKRDFRASTAQIADVCGMALEVVLNNFGDFNVSTIDSFFQSVLRTFAYETNLADTYQVEMDSDLLATVGIDTSLEEINAGGNPPVRYWMERLMGKRREKGANWNVFARSSGKSALYQEFLASAKKMENESYKQNRQELDLYFKELQESGLTFRNVYERLEETNERKVREAHKRMKRAASEFLKMMENMSDDMGLNASPVRHAGAIMKSIPFGNKEMKTAEDDFLFKDSKIENKLADGCVMLSASKKYTKTGKPTKLMSRYGTEIERVEAAAAPMYEAWMEWKRVQGEPRFLYWLLYRDTLLYLGLLQEIRRKVSDYLQDNGLVELSDTGVILRRIIDDSEVPFIYERLGAKLSHFLIDEFQDTSALQWENMSPLLRESVGRGEESLVIGDAKQSIYRFRNADSSIITERLPEEFAGNHAACGDSVEENTNWRSDKVIVEFNNYLFHSLASRVKDAYGQIGGASEVYAGVVQRPSHTAQSGLVSVKFVESCEATDQESDDSGKAYFNDFGTLVGSLLSRGYRQRDIAFLVNTRKEGTQIIDTLMAYNASLPEGGERLEFVSEESLLVASSKAVTTVIAVLRAISEPHGVKLVDEKERHRKGLGSWEQIGGHFHLYVMQHGGTPTPELLEQFKESIGSTDDPSLKLQQAVASMQTNTLPALIEMAISMYVDKEQAEREAPYISALQDMVLEYSERNPTDVASFLRWWQTTGNRRSITSPKDIDAIKVMTIHKSKGLQFKCVIVPGVSFRFSPTANKTEWLWVEPDASVGDDGATGIPLPPKVPVESQRLGSLLKKNEENPLLGEGELHREVFAEYAHAYMMDVLNKVYVAFTRTEEELHIYVPMPKTKAASLRKRLGKNTGEEVEDYEDTDQDTEMEKDVTEESFDSMTDALTILTLHDKEFKALADDTRQTYMPGEEMQKRVEVMAHDEGEEPAGRGYRDTEIARIEFGRPRTKEEKEEERRREREKKLGQSGAGAPATDDFHVAGGYVSLDFPKKLRFRRPDTGMLTADDEDSDTYLDPRSEGNIIHGVLERMETADDLERALRYMRVKGKVSSGGERELKEKLRKMLSDEIAAGWFRPGLRVLTERALLTNSEGRRESKRPDRIVVDEERCATVIDYKTGEELPSHRRQVEEYVCLLRNLTDSTGTPLFTNVEGWLWYLLEDKKVKICK